MPRREDHLHAATINEQLAVEFLAMPAAFAWSPVVAFYAALHLVDAYLATRDVHPRSHSRRLAHFERNPALQAIYRDYRFLERRSREARYDLIAFDEAESRRLIDDELQRIRMAIQALLAAANP